MLFNKQNLDHILSELKPFNATLVAVSKTKPAAAIKAVYASGLHIFGENYVQELAAKQRELPQDIQWHFIGHLQSNKVKQIAGFVSLIQGVDSLKLLQEIDKQAAKVNRVIDCLFEVHIATEPSKYGLTVEQTKTLFNSADVTALKNVRMRGLMGMSTLTEEENIVRSEFQSLRKLFDELKASSPDFNILSMGMTSDYKIALQEGSTMVRIGSAIFGERD